MLRQHLILAKRQILLQKKRHLTFYHPPINMFFEGFTKNKNKISGGHGPKIRYTFCFDLGLLHSLVYTSILSAVYNSKLILLFIKKKYINFSSASICRSDMRKSRGDEKRKTKIYLLNQNLNCDLMKTVLYLSLSLAVISSLQEDITLSCSACLP